MIAIFSEIAFLSDRDLSALLAEIDNRVLLIALYTCDPIVKERIFSRFSYIGMKSYEIDQATVKPSMPADITACQSAIVEIANRMIEDREFDDYCAQRVS